MNLREDLLRGIYAYGFVINVSHMTSVCQSCDQFMSGFVNVSHMTSVCQSCDQFMSGFVNVSHMTSVC